MPWFAWKPLMSSRDPSYLINKAWWALLCHSQLTYLPFSWQDAGWHIHAVCISFVLRQSHICNRQSYHETCCKSSLGGVPNVVGRSYWVVLADWGQWGVEEAKEWLQRDLVTTLSSVWFNDGWDHIWGYSAVCPTAIRVPATSCWEATSAKRCSARGTRILGVYSSGGRPD